MKKCFDSVNHNALWYKMNNIGINGKMLRIFRSVYNSIKFTVRHNHEYSQLFDIAIGLKQGDVCSPILYSLFVDDLEQHLSTNGCTGVNLYDMALLLFLYADDMCVISEDPEDLQCSLNNLKLYCDTWGLQVNTEKTKIMVFRKRGRVRQHEKWTYNGTNLDVVDDFNYLGVVFNHNGSFNRNQQLLAGKALKAMNVLFCNTKDFDFSPKTMCQLFDSFVTAILNYGSEICGFYRMKDLERLHLKFCKRVLGVKLSTCNAAVYGDLGRYPLYIGRYVRVLKYWFKILYSENVILKTLYLRLCDNMIERGHDNWVSKVKQMLSRYGFLYVWENPNAVDVKQFVCSFKQRLLDDFFQSWSGEIRDSQVLSLYKELKVDFKYEMYLDLCCNITNRRAITRIRLSAHRLRIQTGRYGRYRVERNERRCTLCDKGDIEDEFHFIVICKKYKTVRKRYIDKYYWERPSMYKLCELLKTSDKYTLNRLACYLNCAMKIRENSVNDAM